MPFINLIKNWFSKKPEPSDDLLLKTMLQSIANVGKDEYSCAETHELIDQYAEQISTKDEAAELMPLVQRHIEMCPECHEELVTLLQVLEAVSNE